MITYAAGIWANSITLNQRAILKSITRPFLLRMAGAYKTTSTSSLFALLKIPPIDLVAINLAKKFLLLHSAINTFSLTNELDSSQLDSVIKISSVPPQDRFLHFSDSLLPTAYDIFTDGSKIDGKVGLALCIFHNKTFDSASIYKLSSFNTNFQAEITAIYLAVKWAADNNTMVNIHTDSLSSIFALKSYTTKSHFLHTIRVFLQQHIHLFSLHWVKAHNNNPENDLADSYAKQATSSGNFLFIPQPRSLVRATFNKNLYHDWTLSWSQPHLDLRTKRFFPSLSSISPILSPPIIQFITGHGPFPSYLFRFKIRSNSLCPCGLIGTPDHYILDCPSSNTSRLPSSLLTLFSSSPSFWIAQILKDSTLKHLLIQSILSAVS